MKISDTVREAINEAILKKYDIPEASFIVSAEKKDRFHAEWKINLSSRGPQPTETIDKTIALLTEANTVCKCLNKADIEVYYESFDELSDERREEVRNLYEKAVDTLTTLMTIFPEFLEDILPKMSAKISAYADKK